MELTASYLKSPQFMHQSFETPAPPPHSGLSGGLRGLSPHKQFILVLHFGEAGNSLEITVFASPTGLFAGRSMINLFISWLPTVLRLAIISCFTKVVPCIESRGGRGNAPLTFVLGNRGLHSLSLA